MALPPSVQLSYRMTGSAGGLNYQASAQLDWNNAGSSYDSRITVSAFMLGARSLVSRGQIDTGGLAPLRFADNSRKRELAAHFEADKKQITFSSNAPPAVWVPPVADMVVTPFLVTLPLTPVGAPPAPPCVPFGLPR